MMLLAVVWFVWFCWLWDEMSVERVDRRIDRAGLWLGAMLIPPSVVCLVVAAPALFLSYLATEGLGRIEDWLMRRADWYFYLFADVEAQNRRLAH